MSMGEPFPSRLKKYSKKLSYSYCVGTEPTLALLRLKPEMTLKVFLKMTGLGRQDVKEIIEICQKNDIEYEYNDREIDRFAVKENTYAIAAFKVYESELDPNENHIVLFNPTNTGNMGTIIRTMLAFGMKDLAVIRPAVNIFDPKIIRSTMGTFFQARFQYFDSFDDYVNHFERQLYLFLPQASKSLRGIEVNDPYSLVFGNEATGIPKEYWKHGEGVNIPQTDNIDSVNLSIAASIAIYEFTKSKFD